MRGPSIAYLSCRLLSLYTFVLSVQAFFNSLAFLEVARGFPGQSPPSRQVWIGMSGALTLFVLALLLWVLARAFADALLPVEDADDAASDETERPPRDGAPGAVVAISVLGLYFAVQGLSFLVRSGLPYIGQERVEGLDVFARLGGPAIEMLVGAALVVGAWPVAEWMRLVTVEYDDEDEADEGDDAADFREVEP